MGVSASKWSIINWYFKNMRHHRCFNFLMVYHKLVLFMQVRDYWTCDSSEETIIVIGDTMGVSTS